MLFIYYALALGGIETFYVRMAKERFLLGKKTKILFVAHKSKSNAELLKEIRKYADIFFLEDYVFIPNFLFKRLPYQLLLILPLRKQKLFSIFNDIKQIHTSSSIYGFFYIKIMSILKINIPLTIGIYHSKEFTWGGEKIPYYEKKNRVLFFNYLNQKNLVFFNEKLVSSYEDTIGYSLNEVNIFPIGVVDLKSEDIQYKPIRDGEITIGSVGRLVGFKAYNLWMIDIINILIKKGIKAQYLVYGEGPLKEEMQRKINALGLQDSVFLRGHLEYSLFPQVVRELDVFVGSGTAIVEAASLGVPSLVGIESVSEPLTYGFLADVPGFTYNEDNVHPKVSALDKFIEFIEMNAKDVTSLQVAHYNKSKIFSMETCVENFDRITPLALDSSIVKKHAAFYFRLSYSLSFFLFALLSRIKGKSMAITMYD